MTVIWKLSLFEKLFIIIASEFACLIVIRNVADREEDDPIKECFSKPSLVFALILSILQVVNK